jgi:hypothetical protein
MRKTLFLSALSVLLIGGAFVHGTADSADACKRTKFDTKLVADACTNGGVAKAKDVMKKWVKEVKSKQAGLECATCHSKMAPTYDLKPDGLATFKKLGGQ